MNLSKTVYWSEGDTTHSALWRSENGIQAPHRIVLADDGMTADHAYRLACEGGAILWRGDYQNARQLLQAISRRIDKRPSKKTTTTSMPEAFHLYRQSQLQRARILGALLIQLDAAYHIALRRAPDVKQACLEAYGLAEEVSLVSLRELSGVIGAHEWRKNGVDVPLLDGKIYPHYGVFSPVRGEYLELIADMPLDGRRTAFDIGTGTGVIAALLAIKGVADIVATDMQIRAIACAQENIRRLGLQNQVTIMQTDLFPPGKAEIIVCNPPWLPASANSTLDHAVYDPGNYMLRGFLTGLTGHLETDGEGWLILSDLAEHLGLRSRQELLDRIAAAGLQVVERRDIKARHPKALDRQNLLHSARKSETTSLWRLKRSP